MSHGPGSPGVPPDDWPNDQTEETATTPIDSQGPTPSKPTKRNPAGTAAHKPERKFEEITADTLLGSHFVST
jgi:hypothetical protein